MITLLFVLTAVFLLLRIPLGAGMLLACLIVLVLGGLPPEVVVMRTFEGLLPFPILAVPLFYIVGMLCNATSITDRIMTLAQALVGGMRAGLAHVNIVASMLFAGVSGSSTADTAGIGAVIIPRMLKAGYSKALTVAVTACSSTLGNIIPPSILMVIYGAFGSVSIGMMFLGGVIPGLLIGFGQMLLVSFIARRQGIGINDFGSEQRPRLLPALAAGWAPVGVPLVIIGGVVGGIFTATESAAFAIMYVLILGAFVFRDLNLKMLPGLTVEAGKFVGLVMIMVSAGAVFGWILSYYDFPSQVVDLFDAFGAGRYEVLFAVFVFFLIMGMITETVPLIIMFLPVIQALGDAAGIHPVQMGLVIVMTCALGLATPPHGVCLLIAAKIADVHPRSTMLITLVFCLWASLVIMLAMLIPDVTLLLPKLLMPRFFALG